MKGNIKTYSTITQCVSEALMDGQESDVKKEQYTRFALKYFHELNFKKGNDIKTVSLNMKPWKAIELPNDCIDWITIGIQCGEDIKTFVKDTYETALLHQTDENGVKVANQPCPDYYPLEDWPVWDDTQVPLFNLTSLGEDPGRLFGLMVKDNGLGYFTENRNKDSCEIQFRGQIPSDTKIYLQYLSSGINACGETLVHPYFKEYIIAGIHVERIRHGNKSEMWRLNDAKEELTRQFWLVQDYTWEWSAEDIIEILKSGYGLYPKH
jgi:hypothetical protein